MMVESIDQPCGASFVVSLFRRFFVSSFLHFVVLSFCRFAVETEKPTKFQFFESQTQPAAIGTIAMTTRLTHLSARSRPGTSVKYLDEGSRDNEKTFCVKSPLTKMLVLLALSEKSVGFLFRSPEAMKSLDEYVLRDGDGLSKACTKDRSSSTPLG